MIPDWHPYPEETPPLDDRGRCDHLWLCDSQGDKPVIKGKYVDFGLDEAGPETGEFSDENGNPFTPTYWAVAQSQETEPPEFPYTRFHRLCVDGTEHEVFRQNYTDDAGVIVGTFRQCSKCEEIWD